MGGKESDELLLDDISEYVKEIMEAHSDYYFVMGSGSTVVAYHFLATAQAESRRAPGSTTDRDSTATHSQAFYIVGPGAPPVIDPTP